MHIRSAELRLIDFTTGAIDQKLKKSGRNDHAKG